MRARLELAAVLLLALGLRLPFLNQAFQLDDPYYLAGARYVQHDPAHPWRTSYVFLGIPMDMRGHPHPPFDVWYLGLALKLGGTERELPLHLWYLPFTLLAAGAMYGLARRFSPRPLLATLLFLAIPAFVVHGHGLESDLPFTALWMAAAAAFIYAVDHLHRPALAGAAVLLALASLAAYQAVLLVPVLGLYAWTRKRWAPALVVSMVPVLVTGGYQLYERVSDGALPAAVLIGHFEHYGLQSLHNKVKNALALTAHLGWVVFPPLGVAAFGKLNRTLWVLAGAATLAAVFVDRNPLFWASFGIGVVVLLSVARSSRPAARGGDASFLSAWVLLFFAGALIVFFAGAARYLLPIGAPVAILTTRVLERRPRWLLAGFLLLLPFSLALARAHWEQSGAYRDFVRSLAPRFDLHRVWINGEWGLQYYGQQAGARPLLRDKPVQPGDWVLTCALCFPAPVSAPGTRAKRIAEEAVTPRIPLRVIALNSRSAFSTIAFGVRPFDITTAPADYLTAEVYAERKPTREFLPMNAPEAQEQIVSGVSGLENNAWRWTAQTAVIALKRPAGPARIEVRFTIPDQSPARRVTLALDGAPIAEKVFPGPGTYILDSDTLPGASGTARLSITVDKTYSAPGDLRRLGIILTAAGFVPAPPLR